MAKQKKTAYPVTKVLISYKPKYIYSFFKRFFDIVVSGLAILLLSWLFIILAILVKCSSKGPILYRSTRYTKNGKPFNFLKFRSMVVDADKLERTGGDFDGGIRYKRTDDPRITKVGKFLRKTSLDELPQLFNILSGSMSIVGPRPPIECEVLQYDERAMQRLLVKGGLTCIWQCSGRSDVSFEEQVEMDIKYIEKRGFFFDLWLIIKTIPAVLAQKGAK